MKNIICLLVISIMLTTSMIYVQADTWDTAHWGTEPSLSYTTYPYRIMYQAVDNRFYYVATKNKWRINYWTTASGQLSVQAYSGDSSTQITFYRLDYVNGNVEWTHLGTGNTGYAATTHDIYGADWICYSTHNLDRYDIGAGTTLANYYTVDTLSNQVFIYMPPNGYKDVIKTITYHVQYKTAKTTASSYQLEILDSNLNAISHNSDVATYELLSNTFSSTPGTDGLCEGYMKFSITYKTTGTKSVYVRLKDKETGEAKVSAIKQVTIKEFVDSDNDGRDDETGQDNYTPPSAGEGGSWEGDIGSSVNTLTSAYNDLRQGVVVIGTLMGNLFGFLPAPVQSLINVCLIVLLIITLLKIIRG